MLQLALAAVAGVLCVVITIQGLSMGRARSSALLALSGTVAVLTTVSAFQSGVYDGGHLAGALTAAGLLFVVFTRTDAVAPRKARADFPADF